MDERPVDIALSTDLDDPSAIAYFTWDAPLTVAEIKRKLREDSPPQRARLLGKILREARDTDVWKFTTPREVLDQWEALLFRCRMTGPTISHASGAWIGRRC